MNSKIRSITEFLTAKSAQSSTVDKSSSLFYKELFWIILSVITFGLIAHGYVFFDAAFTPDSLNALFADHVENAWKISLGRILKPAYQALFCGNFAVPWLIGCLSLLWIGCAFYQIVRMFKITAPICIILTAGILITNLTVSLTAASYIHDLDANMFALLMAVCAAFQWNRYPRISVTSVLCIAVAMSLYQAYVSVCIMLMLMQCILSTMQGEKPSYIINKGIKAGITLVLGALCYAILLYLIRHITGITMITGTGNGLNMMTDVSIKSLLAESVKSYLDMYNLLFTSWASVFPMWFVRGAHITLFACGASVIFVLIKNRVIDCRRLLLFSVLALSIPPAVFLSTILSNGASMHLLMMYSIWLIYLLLLLILYHTPVHSSKIIMNASRVISAVLILILLWGNIRTSNTLYLLKDMQHEAASSLLSRVLYRMEECNEYETGETPVAFIGTSDLITTVPGAERYANLVGMNYNLLPRSTIHYYDPIYKKIAYNLGNPLNICDSETHLSFLNNEEVRQMPCYPDDNCVKMIDGVLVVKLGN